jgi:C-terminal processing protease CtpA/Prc
MAKVELLAGNVGLVEIRPVLYPAVLAGDRIAAAMTLIAGCDALILDLRACLGGSPDSVALLCSYVFDDEPVHLNSMRYRDDKKVDQSWTQAWVPGRRFGGAKPVAVLTSGSTFSAGEEIAYDLQQLGRARIVGEQTGGGANPRVGHRVHDHLEATIPIARAVNPVSGTNWELAGVTPDIPTSSGQALEMALQVLGQN